jgi:hypothetical protein
VKEMRDQQEQGFKPPQKMRRIRVAPKSFAGKIAKTGEPFKKKKTDGGSALLKPDEAEHYATLAWSR